jgi:hypothetical protein
MFLCIAVDIQHRVQKLLGAFDPLALEPLLEQASRSVVGPVDRLGIGIKKVRKAPGDRIGRMPQIHFRIRNDTLVLQLRNVLHPDQTVEMIPEQGIRKSVHYRKGVLAPEPKEKRIVFRMAEQVLAVIAAVKEVIAFTRLKSFVKIHSPKLKFTKVPNRFKRAVRSGKKT